MWCDAICIDQNNTEERNHQVPLMRAIFSGCNFAFLWLGDEGEESSLAMYAIEEIAKLGNVPDPPVFMPDSIRALIQQEKSRNGRIWLALQRLLQRDFWHRVWILQELILPKDALVVCGSAVVSWKTFRKMSSILDPSGSVVDLTLGMTWGNVKVQMLIFHLFRPMKLKDNAVGIYLLVQETMHLKASDPRDKIYGLLALDSETTMKPDYSKSVQRLYVEFAKSTLLCGTNLDLLEFACPCDDHMLSGLPSWVPDWNQHTLNRSTAAVPWRYRRELAALDGRWTGETKYEWEGFTFLEAVNSTVLFARGQICERIASVTSKDSWLAPVRLSPNLENMYGQQYIISSTNGQQTIPMLVALFSTLVQDPFPQLDHSPACSWESDLWIGFCGTMFSRMLHSTELSNNGPGSWPPSLRPLEPQIRDPLLPNHEEKYQFREESSLNRRMFIELENGKFGLGPAGTRKGDVVCKLYGSYLPVVLRKVDSHYILIDACWVLGYIYIQGVDVEQSEMIDIW